VTLEEPGPLCSVPFPTYRWNVPHSSSESWRRSQ